MAIAAMWGTTVGYDESEYSVMIETTDGRVANISKDSFNYLYFKLDDYTAALKEDCIHYATYDPNLIPFDYPDWFIQAVDDMCIFDDGETHAFYDEYNMEPIMNPGTVVLRNYMGHLMFMPKDQFDKYYDTLEG